MNKINECISHSDSDSECEYLNYSGYITLSTITSMKLSNSHMLCSYYRM